MSTCGNVIVAQRAISDSLSIPGAQLSCYSLEAQQNTIKKRNVKIPTLI